MGNVIKEVFDTLVWDSSCPDACLFEWPTYGCRFPKVRTSARATELEVVESLLREDWELVSVTTRRGGFLWLNTYGIYTFRKRVEWLREGSATSFVGSRLTPVMERT